MAVSRNVCALFAALNSMPTYDTSIPANTAIQATSHNGWFGFPHIQIRLNPYEIYIPQKYIYILWNFSCNWFISNHQP